MGQVSKEGSMTIQMEGWNAIQVAIYRMEDPHGRWIKKTRREERRK